LEQQLPQAQDLEIASDPTTSPEILRQLSLDHEEVKIRKLVAKNPNTPITALLSLAKEFPREVARNPVIILLQLENPGFIEEADYWDLGMILQGRYIPSIFIDSAIAQSRYDVTEKLLKIPTLSEIQLGLLLEKIEQSTENSTGQFTLEDRLFRLLIQHPSCTTLFQFQIARQGCPFLQEHLFENCIQDLTIDSISLIETLIDNGSFPVLICMACHPKMTDELLDRLFELDRPQFLQYIVNHFDWYESEWVVTNCYLASLTERIHLRLAQNSLRDPKLRIEIQRTLIKKWQGLTLPILEILSRDPSFQVRSSLASRRGLPAKIILQLARDLRGTVQKNLIKNLSIPGKVLEILAHSHDSRMQEVAASHPNTPLKTLGILAENPQLQEQIACNPSTPTTILQQLAQSGAQDFALTRNPQISASIIQPILLQLSNDPRYSVRKLVARHSQTPRVILEKLATDPEPKVSRLAQQKLTSLS
jgi:hypothetical protein